MRLTEQWETQTTNNLVPEAQFMVMNSQEHGEVIEGFQAAEQQA